MSSTRTSSLCRFITTQWSFFLTSWMLLSLTGALVARLERALLGTDLTDATDVERTHRQLRAGLTNRLRRDHADRLADVDHVASSEVTAVAQRADAAAGLAREHRADLHPIDTGVVDDLDVVLGDLRVRRTQHFAGVRIDDVLEHDATEDAVAEALDDLATLDERHHLHALAGAAVELADDRVLRDVDEAASQVTRVRRLERGVREALTSAVGRDEVLEHRQTFTEVRRDRRLDDLARRLGHQAAHTGELPHLLLRAARARVRHDEDRVERRRPLDGPGLGVLELARSRSPSSCPWRLPRRPAPRCRRPCCSAHRR